MTAVLVGLVAARTGADGVHELLERAGSARSREYLMDTGNWISYDEAIALWRAGGEVTHHPQFARLVGEDSGRRLNGSAVATLLRSLGSPENVYKQIGVSSTRFSTVSTLEAVSIGPGVAEVVAAPIPGFPRSFEHCEWTRGLLTQPTVLFGLAPAVIEHDECAAFGAPACRYTARWETGAEATTTSSPEVQSLKAQLAGMEERLRSMFATAADLIAADEIDAVLARITERAAAEVRAPRHLLAVKLAAGEELLLHHRGLDPGEPRRLAERILSAPLESLPESWLAVNVRSNLRDYGRLVAMHDNGRRFFPQERELLEVYARYAASALDGATALSQAKQLYEQSRALLELSRALAAAGTSDEVAGRLADAVPAVVDCDRVSVYLWDPSRKELTRRATGYPNGEGRPLPATAHALVPTPGGALERLVQDPNGEPIVIDDNSKDQALRAHFAALGADVTIAVPLGSRDAFLGLLTVSVDERATRLEPAPKLLDMLSGVAAQATSALKNGRLVDTITHAAHHDSLTGLANRRQFAERLHAAVERARGTGQLVTLFYIDLDGFKPVNDELGHEFGDELLAAVGRRLSACVRDDDSVARLGGDEFAVLIGPHNTRREAEPLAERLTKVFRDPFTIAGERLQIGASVGRATFPGEGRSADDLLRVADAAMFSAKRGIRRELVGRIRRRTRAA